MGLKDRLTGGETADATSTGHYDAEVNKGSLNMSSFTRSLNSRWDDGWELAQIYSHDGNTVTVWERRS